MMPTEQRVRVTVWDPLVRVGHWALVAAFAVAYLSAEEEGADAPALLHVWCGYAIGVIVALRVVWGFVGPRNARFSEFVRGPGAVVRELGDLVRGRAARHLGHGPAAGAMIVALLVCLAATVATGLVAYGDRGKGPLARAASITTTSADAATARADENTQREGEHSESSIGELHSTIANVTLALIVLHILGVAVASRAHRENLVAAMITGKKRAED